MSVLASPGTPTSRQWPRVKMAARICSMTSAWPTMARRSWSIICVRAWLNWVRYSLMRSLDTEDTSRGPGATGRLHLLYCKGWSAEVETGVFRREGRSRGVRFFLPPHRGGRLRLGLGALRGFLGLGQLALELLLLISQHGQLGLLVLDPAGQLLQPALQLFDRHRTHLPDVEDSAGGAGSARPRVTQAPLPLPRGEAEGCSTSWHRPTLGASRQVSSWDLHLRNRNILGFEALWC